MASTRSLTSVPTLPLSSAMPTAATAPTPTSRPASRASRRRDDTMPIGSSATIRYQMICSGRYTSAAVDCALPRPGHRHVALDRAHDESRGIDELETVDRARFVVVVLIEQLVRPAGSLHVAPVLLRRDLHVPVGANLAERVVQHRAGHNRQRDGDSDERAWTPDQPGDRETERNARNQSAPLRPRGPCQAPRASPQAPRPRRAASPIPAHARSRATWRRTTPSAENTTAL